MDGNRRYAKKQQLSTKEGYKKGMEKFLHFVTLQVKYKIPQTSFFALSNDNYVKRPLDEKKAIFELVKAFSENKEIKEFFIEHKVHVHLRGDLKEIEKVENKVSKFNKETITNLKKELEEQNSIIQKPQFTVNIALNYDGQKEILHAIKEIGKKIEKGDMKSSSITQKTIKQNLWFNDSNSPEVIVRTGNAPRLSGFLLWDSEYSEIYLTKKLWPEMDEADFVQINNWYKEQQRNFGK